MPVFGRLLRLILTDIFLNSLTEIARAHVTVSAADAKKSNNILTPATKKASDGAGSTALTNPTNSTERCTSSLIIPLLLRTQKRLQNVILWILFSFFVKFSFGWFAGLVDLAQCRLERFDHRCYTLKTFEAVQMDDVLDLFYFIDCDLLEGEFLKKFRMKFFFLTPFDLISPLLAAICNGWCVSRRLWRCRGGGGHQRIHWRLGTGKGTIHFAWKSSYFPYFFWNWKKISTTTFFRKLSGSFFSNFFVKLFYFFNLI